MSTKSSRRAGAKSGPSGASKRSALKDVVTREETFNIHKATYGRQFKRRAPRTIKAIVDFAQKSMLTPDVRIDPLLNKAIWAFGIRNIPRRIRLRLSRKRNDAEGAEHKLYTYVQAVDIKNPKGLTTTLVEED